MKRSRNEHDAATANTPGELDEARKEPPGGSPNHGIGVIDRLTEIQNEAFVQLELPGFQDTEHVLRRPNRIFGRPVRVNLCVFVAADAQIHHLESKPGDNVCCFLQASRPKGERTTPDPYDDLFSSFLMFNHHGVSDVKSILSYPVDVFESSLNVERKQHQRSWEGEDSEGSSRQNKFAHT